MVQCSIAAVCMLPKEVGPCRGYFPRYYFDSNKGACVQFIFSGCRGNLNNFERLADCKEKCENLSKGMHSVCFSRPITTHSITIINLKQSIKLDNINKMIHFWNKATISLLLVSSGAVA